MARVRCPACGYDEFDGPTCKRCGQVLSGPAAKYQGAGLSSRLLARLIRPRPPTYRANMPWRRPLLVALMSAAVIGSGHLYCKDYVVGAAYLGAAVILTWSVTNISLWALFVLAVLGTIRYSRPTTER